jgi:Zn-dependent protease
MAGYISNNYTLLFFALMLIVVMRVRLRVSPRASLYIAKPPADVFDHLDIWDGKVMDYGRVSISHRLANAQNNIYEFSYRTTMVGGASRSSSAQFRIAERQPHDVLVLRREGLEGRPENSELLELNYVIAQEAAGSRLSVTQVWGPRPLLAQVLARADLWGGAHRIKGLIETGIPNERPFSLISAAVAIVTGLLTLVTFWWAFGFRFALFAILALIVHEFGHLLAYRLIGQPWGRIMFLPFVGAVALPRMAFESQSQLVFAALMGPGFSLVLAFACIAPALLGYQPNPYLLAMGSTTALLNAFNLMPVAPLDGGIAMRSVLGRIMGDFSRIGFMLMGVGLIAIGIEMRMAAVVVAGAFTLFLNFNAKKIDQGLAPMPVLHVGISIFAFVAMCAAYAIFLVYFFNQASLAVPVAAP